MSINEYLNNLPDEVEKIDLSNKNLDELPDLSRFHNLKELHCENNRLTEIPTFPNLKILYCNYNQLTSLPILPNIEALYCNTNRLTSLPLLSNLKRLDCQNNRLTSIPTFPNLNTLQCANNKIWTVLGVLGYRDKIQNLHKLNKFRHLYYSLKFKKKIRDWLWIKVREPKIKEKYSAFNLSKLL
jgi:Leucine-rich repeat (LRR) protein